MGYVDDKFYKDTYKGTLLVDSIEAKLDLASADIDTLTYNRVKAKGFDKLTQFQQEKVKMSICLHAEFVHQYGDMLNSPISGYSAGSTSVSFSQKNIHVQSGVTTSSHVMGLLSQTGLTTGLFI